MMINIVEWCKWLTRLAHNQKTSNVYEDSIPSSATNKRIMRKKKKHIFLPNRNKNNKGIIEEIEKAYEMNIAMPLHIKPLIEKTLYELCDVRANISPL